MRHRAAVAMIVATLGTLSACSDAATKSVTTTDVVSPVVATPFALASAPTPSGGTLGSAYTYDVTQGGATTRGGTTPITYAVSFTTSSLGLTATGGTISGTPTGTGVVSALVRATDAAGATVTAPLSVVIFAGGLPTPSLTAPASYTDAAVPLAASFTAPGAPGGTVLAADNTPASNTITDAGATLGRVLFYDRRLSISDDVSCSSCHQQRFDFSDTAKLSLGVGGARTARHSMSLTNARYYRRGRMFWDERAASLEDQVLQPIQNPAEMGLTLAQLAAKLQATPYYAPLFAAAFGTAEITTDRASLALAQFVRAIRSQNATFDASFRGVPLNAQQAQGQQLFLSTGCARCHATNAQVMDDVHNTGLDATITDVGAGNGKFKSPSLRNVAVRGRFMHDGRFASLAEVVEFYNSGVQPNPGLDPRMKDPSGAPRRLGLSATDKAALVAFLESLTEASHLTDARLTSPFAGR